MLPQRSIIPAAKTALFVGTILCVVNDSFGAPEPHRIALNYLVPFLVASYSRWSMQRTLARADGSPSGPREASQAQPDKSA